MSTGLRARGPQTLGSRIADWLRAVPPDQVKLLVLRLGPDGAEKPCLWQATRPEPDGKYDPDLWGSQIQATCENAADLQDQRLTGTLTWHFDNGEVWTALPLVIDPELGAPEHTGSFQAGLAQEQKHKEQFAKIQFAAIQETLKTLATTNKEQSEVLRERSQHLASLERDNTRLRDELHTAVREKLEIELEMKKLEDLVERFAGHNEELAAALKKAKDSGTQDAQVFSLLNKIADKAGK